MNREIVLRHLRCFLAVSGTLHFRRAAERLGMAQMLLLWFAAGSHAQMGKAPFTVVEAGIPEMRAALDARRVTSRELVTQYLTRIGLYEDRLRAIVTVNPHVLEEADERDRERAQGRARGALHGIPIAVKDNSHA